jgi:hypothetical protein
MGNFIQIQVDGKWKSIDEYIERRSGNDRRNRDRDCGYVRRKRDRMKSACHPMESVHNCG